MDFPNKNLIAVLFLVGFITSSLAENSVRNNEKAARKNSRNKSDENPELIPTMKRCKKIKTGKMLQIRGIVVRLSEAYSENCSATFYEIYATEKVLIDTDFEKLDQQFHLTIIAPIWDVIGTRKIVLTGEDGKKLGKPKADNGKEDGYKHGASGEAGLPGGPTGNFYGIAQTIINAKNLTISLTGGRGGPGQYGGDGAKGKVGKSWEKDTSTLDKFPPFTTFTIPGWIVTFNSSKSSFWTLHYKIWGKKATDGGRGGIGGVGGAGGKVGNFTLFELDNENGNSLVVSKISNGRTGLDGNGGIGGGGSVHGSNWTLVENIFYGNFSKDNYVSWSKDGANGKDGLSRKMQKPPAKAVIIKDFPSTVNEYKLFARLHMTDDHFQEKNALSRFYDSLNNRKEITSRYDTRSLVEEFLGLELQYFRLKKKLNLTPFYEGLRQRMQEYEQEPNNPNEDSEEYKEVIRDLFMDISDKFQVLNRSKTFYPVMPNLRKHFPLLVQAPVEELKSDANFDALVEWLDESVEKENDLIEQAQYMFSEVIPTVTNDLENSLDQELDALLNETYNLENTVDEKLVELKSQRQHLQNNILSRALLKFLQGACSTVASLVKPIAAIADSLTGCAPKYIQNLQVTTDKYLKSQSEKEEEVIKYLKLLIENVKIHASEKQKDVIDLVWQLIQNMWKSPVISTKGRLREIEQICEKEETQIKAMLRGKIEAGQSIEEYKEALYHAEKCKNYLKKYILHGAIGENKPYEYPTKPTEVYKAVEASEVVLIPLKRYKDLIDSITQPMLKDMFQSNTVNNSREVDKINLWFTNWNVTTNLEKVKLIMENMTREFSVSDEIKWTFDNVISLLETIKDLNMKAMECKEKKEDKRFIEGLQTIRRKNLLIRDNRLRRSRARLQVALSYNVASDENERWLFAFKQFSFPNAGKVLQTYKWPNILKYKDSYSLMEDIQNSVKELKAVINSPDKIVALQEGKSIRSFPDQWEGPFYIWRNEEYSAQLRDLLSGKQVELKANPYYSNLSAIQFNRIEIRITSKKPELQENLDQILIGFEVNLTHMGDSKYRCDKEVYQITNTPTELNFGLILRTKYGILSPSSKTYKALLKGDFVLSPYATWHIQLEAKTSNEFRLLEQFYDGVDLELRGNGTALNPPTVNCIADMKKYYTKIKTGLQKRKN